MKEKPPVPPRHSQDSSAIAKTGSSTEFQPLQLAWSALRGDYPNRESFSSEKDFRLFCNYYNVLKAICRRPPQKRKDEEIKEILQESKISPDVSSEIFQLLRSSDAKEVDRFLLQEKPRIVSLASVQWRISVTISTSFVARALVPCVHLLLSLSDGRVIEAEMTLQKFHQLRHAIASLLKEMQLLESLPIMQK